MEDTMTEEKKSKNPFINMAAEAKAKKTAGFANGSQPEAKAPKPNKGFGGSSLTRKVGRGR